MKLIFLVLFCLWKISYIEAEDVGGTGGVEIHGQYSKVTSNRVSRSDSNKGQCLPDGTGRFPYAKDCRQYLYCMKGRGQVKTCEPGKRFNRKTNKCDWLANVDCWTQEDQVEVIDAPLRFTLSQRFTTADVEPVETKGGQCPKDATGRFPYGKDCRQYLYCMKGRGQIKTCEPSKRFNRKTNKCDWMANVQCEEKTVVSQRFSTADPEDYDTVDVDAVGPRVECERGASGLFEHPYDCSKFVNCANGVTYIQDCGRGTVYNPLIKTCDWPHKVDCEDRTPRQKGETLGQYRERKSSDFGEGVIQPRNNMEIIFEDAEAQVLRTNVKRSERTSLNNRHREGPATRVQVHQQHSQVATNRPPSSTHFGRSDSRAAPDRSALPTTANEHEPPSNSVDEEYFSPVGTECPPDATGQFPYLMDCRQYLNCWKGRGYIQSCNPGTLFNPLTRECDFPSKVQCVTLDLLNHLDSHETAEKKYRELEEAPRNLRENVVGAPVPRFADVGRDYDYEGNPVDPNEPVVECEADTSGLFEHPYDCNKFLNCANGVTYIQNCGIGTVFNPLYKVCDWPYNVDCSNRTPYEGAESKPEEIREDKSLDLSTSPLFQPRFEGTRPTPVYRPTLDLDIAAGDLASQPVRRTGSANTASDSSNKHTSPIYTRPSPVYRPYTTIKPPSSHLLPPVVPTEPPVIVSSRQGHVLATQRRYEPRQQSAAIMSVNRNYEQAKTNVAANPQPNGAAVLPLSEALKLMLRPYFNRSGTIAEEVNLELQLPTLTTTSEPPISKEQESLVGRDDRKESTESLDGYETRRSPKFHHSDDFHRRMSELPGGIQSGAASKIKHSEDFHRRHPEIGRGEGFRHSEDYHRQHPEIGRGEGFRHSEDYHRRHPEIGRGEGFQHSPEFHKNHQHHHHHRHHEVSTTTEQSYLQSSRAHAQPPAPRPVSTTPPTVFFNRDAPLFVAPLAPYPTDVSSDDSFDCGNGKRIEFFEVCDGKDDCGNRKDEADCDHIGYEVRLSSDSGHANEGRVEVKVYDKWGYICDDKFGIPDADVLCRELGFAMGAQEVRLNSFYAANPNMNNDAGTPLFAMDEIECVGNETSLKDCKFNGWGVHDCNAEEVVGVVCKMSVMTCPLDYWLCETSQECIPTGFLCDNTPDCGDGSDEQPGRCNAPLEFRLIGGRTRMEGRVEVKYHGIWGTVCDDDFGAEETSVICRSLGFNGPSSPTKGVFPPGMGQIWLDQVKCVGNESNLDKCSHWHWGEHNCGHTEDVGVRCSMVGTRRRIHPEVEQLLPTVFQHERSGHILPTECGLVKVPTNTPEPDFHFKVVRGTTAKKGFHPWQASIRAKKQTKSAHWCGAVLISRFHLLTAAHCLVGYPKGAYIIRLGDHLSDKLENSEVEIFIENFYIHEDFRKGQHMNNDIAVVLLKQPVRFTDHIQPVCLPTKDTVYEAGRKCTISGWGATVSGSSMTSSELHSGSIPILAPEVCQQKEVYGKYITDGMFCAGSLEENVDACDGDSGGPLVCPDANGGGHTLFGIISWGQHCGYANKPGVYVKVSHYLDWINEKLNQTLANFGV